MIKKLIAFALFPFVISLFCSLGHANPEPLGIVLNKDTLDQVKKKYKVLSVTQSIANYRYHSIDISNIDMETLSAAEVISNHNNVIEGVMLRLADYKFEEICSILKAKYQLVAYQIDRGRNRYMTFRDGDFYIIVRARWFSLKIIVEYTTTNLLRQIEDYNKSDAQREAEREHKAAQLKEEQQQIREERRKQMF